MIGYSAFTNPVHVHSGPTMLAMQNENSELTDARFQMFKLRRKIAQKTFFHFPWHLPVPVLNLAVIIETNRFSFVDNLKSPPLALRFRPPTRA
jgi:hypothetical protein